ncbi:MAG: LamG domain-containing protein [Candidatus Poribacteria bacterium]|nr:LamG domain-containing protein [Candidatus Poribacteria bacterium]
MRQIVSYILITASIFIFPFVSGAIEDDAMVLYFSFDEGKGKDVEDLSGKENHGTLEGDAKWEKNGKINSGVFFNEQIQKGVVAVEASDSLTITKSLTMEVWVYPESVGDYRNVRGQAGPHTYYLSIHQGRPSVWLGCGGAGCRTWNSAKSDIPTDKWTHVAVVYEFDKELRHYINGKLDETYKVGGEITTSQADHWFGNRLDGPWPYGGRLDEFVIYNRVLTEDEIQQDMEQVLSVSPLDKAATTWGLLKKVKR